MSISKRDKSDGAATAAEQMTYAMWTTKTVTTQEPSLRQQGINIERVLPRNFISTITLPIITLSYVPRSASKPW